MIYPCSTLSSSKSWKAESTSFMLNLRPPLQTILMSILIRIVYYDKNSRWFWFLFIVQFRDFFSNQPIQSFVSSIRIRIRSRKIIGPDPKPWSLLSNLFIDKNLNKTKKVSYMWAVCMSLFVCMSERFLCKIVHKPITWNTQSIVFESDCFGQIRLWRPGKGFFLDMMHLFCW